MRDALLIIASMCVGASMVLLAALLAVSSRESRFEERRRDALRRRPLP